MKDEAVLHEGLIMPGDTIEEVVPIDDWLPHINGMNVYQITENDDVSADKCGVYIDIDTDFGMRQIKLSPDTSLEMLDQYIKPLVDRMKGADESEVDPLLNVH
jgi:hypothetical protein